jgi:hypothetical protein
MTFCFVYYFWWSIMRNMSKWQDCCCLLLDGGVNATSSDYYQCQALKSLNFVCSLTSAWKNLLMRLSCWESQRIMFGKMSTQPTSSCVWKDFTIKHSWILIFCLRTIKIFVYTFNWMYQWNPLDYEHSL